MNNFLIYTGLTIGGVETFSINLSIHLQKKGHNVIIIDQNYDSSNTKLYTKYESIDIPVISPESSLGEKVFKNENYYIVPFYETDYLHKYYNKIVELDDILPKLVGYIHSDAAYYYDNAFLFEGITSKFICVSSSIKKKLAGILTSGDTKLIFQKCPLVISSTAKIRDSEVLDLIFVGRISDESKGVFQLVELADYLNDQGVVFKLRIVGTGPDLGELKNKFLTSNYSHQVEFLTDIERPTEILPIYEKSDIILILSYFEGGPLVLCEAMECGVIPVGYDVGILPEVIVNGENGFIFNHSQKELLFKKIVELNSVSLSKLKTSAKKRIGSMNMDMETYLTFFYHMLDSLDELKVPRAISDVDEKYNLKRDNFKIWLIRILGLNEYKRNNLQSYVFPTGIESSRENQLQLTLDNTLKHYKRVYDHMPPMWKKIGALIRIISKYRNNLRFKFL